MGGWAALAQIGGGMISKGLDFGLGLAASKMQAKTQRQLRREEYQDQVHSMKQAGLNPMLAAGIAPGHSSAQPIDTGDSLASSVEKTGHAINRSRENALIDAQVTTAKAQARKSEAEADLAQDLLGAQRANVEADTSAAAARAAEARADTAFTEGPRTALTNRQADTEKARYSLTHAQRYLTLDQQARTRAETGLTTAREAGERSDNVRRDFEAKYVREYASLLRAGKTAQEIQKIMGPGLDVAREALDVFSRRSPRRFERESGSSAKGGSSLPGAGRDQVGPNHPRRYRRLSSGEFIDAHTGEVIKDVGQ